MSDVTPASVPLPPETPVPEIGKYMKCSDCGLRTVNTKAEPDPGVVAAMRGRHQRS
jgi:hypothetical protein